MAWDDLAAPRELLEKLGSENGIQIAGLDQIPHDLWAAADLPPLELIERLTLIAGQYDLTFQVSADGNRLTLLPVPEHVELLRTYPAGRQAQQTAKNFASLAPQARVQVEGDKIIVTGTLEDHERISSPHRQTERSMTKPATADLASKRFTLTVTEQPIGPLLEQLVPQLNLELKIDKKALEQAGALLDQRVSFSVKNATVDELLQAALKTNPFEIRPPGKYRANRALRGEVNMRDIVHKAATVGRARFVCTNVVEAVGLPTQHQRQRNVRDRRSRLYMINVICCLLVFAGCSWSAATPVRFEYRGTRFAENQSRSSRGDHRRLGKTLRHARQPGRSRGDRSEPGFTENGGRTDWQRRR